MNTIEKDEYGFVDEDYDKGIEVDNEIIYVGISTGKENAGEEIFYDGPNACWLTPQTELIGHWDENTEDAIKRASKGHRDTLKQYFYEYKDIKDFSDRDKEIIASFIDENADKIYDAPSSYRWTAFSIRWLYLGEKQRILGGK